MDGQIFSEVEHLPVLCLICPLFVGCLPNNPNYLATQVPRNENPSVSNIDWQAAGSTSSAFTKRGAESTCPTLKITITNSHWLSLLQDRKQQQKRLCCAWKKKKRLRQIEYLSLFGSVLYTFPELCASECAQAHANCWPVFNVEAIEVSMSTGQYQFPHGEWNLVCIM